MTIEELITKLGAFDPDQNVCIVLGGSEDAGMYEIENMPECTCKAKALKKTGDAGKKPGRSRTIPNAA